MLIIMQQGVSESAVEQVITRIEELGFRVHISRGEFRTIIGAIGEEKPVYPEQILSIEGVEKVMPIMKPYKLASREFQPEDSQVQVGSVSIGKGRCGLIAGPCAVESRQSLNEIANMVKAGGANMLRGGAFKPRTSPYSFQGMGEEGLKILRECGDRLGLPIVTEVTDPRNVELVARYADMLQVGARNMQNFVLLSEIGKVHKPVLLKRGPSCTVKDWLMSAEYILSEGNQQVVLCERGSQGFENGLRYTLDVGAIVLAKHDSHLPVIVDPSHAAGRRDLVVGLALAGLAAGADGMIVEVHHCPEKALCDGPQALTNQMFTDLMVQAKKVLTAVGKDV